ncbi:pre-mRNA cleavage complex 2 protein Pcf11-like isoform X1, partial [Leptotrombidium deliense]
MAAKNEEPEAITEYRASLNDLTFNSKPQINMLTMLADDYKEAAPEIVKCIEQRMNSVSADKRLPLLYLMDSICKNINGHYVKLFTQNIVSTFCHVFEKADEKTRLS